MKSKSISKFCEEIFLYLIVILAVIYGTSLTYLQIIKIKNIVTLEKKGQITTATITDYKISDRRGINNKNYKIKYKFTYPLINGTEYYSSSLRTNKSNVFVGIHRKKYKEALKTGQITITFLPDNPNLNTDFDNNFIGSMIFEVIGLIIFFFISIASWFWLIILICIEIENKSKKTNSI